MTFSGGNIYVPQVQINKMFFVKHVGVNLNWNSMQGLHDDGLAAGITVNG
jgi:hypothetical protein